MRIAFRRPVSHDDDNAEDDNDDDEFIHPSFHLFEASILTWFASSFFIRAQFVLRFFVLLMRSFPIACERAAAQ